MVKEKKQKSRAEDSVVKIDSKLLDDVEDFINLEENKFRYVNKKQFIDLAVLDYLKRAKRNRRI